MTMTSEELYTDDERAVERLVKAAEARGGFASVMVLRDGSYHVVATWDDEDQANAVVIDDDAASAAE